MRAPLMILALVLTAAAAWSTPVAAQVGRMARARAAFERGQAAFNAEDYVGAREGFEEAYQLTENPAIRYNLGLVEERVGNFEAAADHYRFYVSRASQEEDLEAAREHLAAVEMEFAARAPREPEPEPEPESHDPPPATDQEVPVAVPLPEPARSEPSLGWGAFAVTLGVGLAATAGFAIGSGVLWSDANTTYDGHRDSCAPACSDAVVADLDSTITVSNALWVTALSVGVLSVGLATALLFSTGSEGEQLSLRLSPTSATLEGQF